MAEPSLNIASLASTMEVLLDCATDALTEPPGRSVIAPGAEVAWDDCCDGQTWIRVVSATPRYPTLPGRSSRATGACSPAGWSVLLGIGIVRCVHSLDEDGNAPTEFQVTLDGKAMLRDFDAMRRGILCCDVPAPLQIERWEPAGPSGGCSGGEWLVTLTFTN